MVKNIPAQILYKIKWLLTASGKEIAVQVEKTHSTLDIKLNDEWRYTPAMMYFHY